MVEIAASDEGHAMGGVANVLVSVWSQPSTVARLKQLAEFEQKLVDRSPGGIAVVTVMESSAFDREFPAAERAEANAIAKRFGPVTLAGLYVVEGAGFRVALARSVIAGISLLSRGKFPTKVVSEVPPGAAWLAEKLPAIDAAVVSAAVERVRAAIGGRS